MDPNILLTWKFRGSLFYERLEANFRFVDTRRLSKSRISKQRSHRPSFRMNFNQYDKFLVNEKFKSDRVTIFTAPTIFLQVFTILVDVKTVVKV